MKKLFLLCLLLFSSLTNADEYPSRPVSIVVGQSLGAGPDILARLYAEVLTKRLNKTVVVINRPGAAGTLAIAEVLKAKPDGHTLLMGTGGMFLIQPLLDRKLSYDFERDFSPIFSGGQNQAVFVARKDFPANNIDELIALAKSNPNKYSFATGGQRNLFHIVGTAFNSMTEIKAIHVPYKGPSMALVDLREGRVDWMIEQYPALKGFIESDKIKVIAPVEHRLPNHPNIAPISEKIPALSGMSWVFITAHKDTPDEIINQLNMILNEEITQPELSKRLKDLDYYNVGGTLKEFKTTYAEQKTKWGKMFSASQIEPE
jgi:tripartite-type tricarboxylate transporter receptor subunit TctC